MEELSLFFDVHKKVPRKSTGDPNGSTSAGDISVDSVDDEDIYGDLESSVFVLNGNNKRSAAANNELEAKLVQARTEIRALQIQNEKLAQENKNYAVNAASLYTTAKGEIDKKNFIIKRLQSQLQEMVTTKSQLTKEQVQEILQSCHNAHREASSQITVDEITKAIQQLADAATPKPDGYKKQYKFGNMSLYLYREQVPFARGCRQGLKHSVKLPKDVTTLSEPQSSKCDDGKEKHCEKRKRRDSESDGEVEHKNSRSPPPRYRRRSRSRSRSPQTSRRHSDSRDSTTDRRSRESENSRRHQNHSSSSSSKPPRSNARYSDRQDSREPQARRSDRDENRRDRDTPTRRSKQQRDENRPDSRGPLTGRSEKQRDEKRQKRA